MGVRFILKTMFRFKSIVLSLLFFGFLTAKINAQQIDCKELVRVDTNVINKNTVFNWYWSSVIIKQLKIKRIREYKVTYKNETYDTTKSNTLFFDKEGKLKRWNSVAFRFAVNGAYLGYVDTVSNLAILPHVPNNHAFTDFFYYTEKRDQATNLLNNSVLVSSPESDTLNVVYAYNPMLYIKGHETEINGNVFVLPNGPTNFLESIKFYINGELRKERFLVYELYE
jgi:hypothetical protein